MPKQNFVDLRFRPVGTSDAPDLDQDPPEEVTRDNGLPVQVVKSTLPDAGSTATTQFTNSTTSKIGVTARAGRKSVLIKNIDGSITQYVSEITPCSATVSLPLLAGESVRLFTAGTVYTMSASATPTLVFVEEF